MASKIQRLGVGDEVVRRVDQEFDAAADMQGVVVPAEHLSQRRSNLPFASWSRADLMLEADGSRLWSAQS